MKIFSLLAGENCSALFLPTDSIHERCLSAASSDPGYVRAALLREPNLRLTFSLIEPDQISLSTGFHRTTDCLLYSWLKIFSKRAADRIVALGSDPSDFISCDIDCNVGETYFLFMPRRLWDVVDIARSKFSLWLPGPPPIPLMPKKLAFNERALDNVPPCFYAENTIVHKPFTELLVTEEFVKEWNDHGFTGALFTEQGK